MAFKKLHDRAVHGDDVCIANNVMRRNMCALTRASAPTAAPAIGHNATLAVVGRAAI
jgi:hypothetical protein